MRTHTAAILAAASPIALAGVPTTRIAYVEQQVPPGFAAGNYIDALGRPSVNALGAVAFQGSLAGPGISSGTDQSVWRENDGTLELLARDGDIAPGVTAFERYNLFYEPFPINDSGHALIRAQLRNGAGSTDTGFWSDRSGALELIAREGDQVIGEPDGVVLDHISRDGRLGGSGAFVYLADLRGGGVTSSNNRAIVSDASGQLTAVARTGDSAPLDQRGIVEFTSFLPHPVINDNGAVAFYAETTGFTSGIYTNAPGSLTAVAVEGEQAPDLDPGVVFTAMNVPGLNNNGHVVFAAFVAGPGTTPDNNRAIWAGPAGDLRIAARHQNPAPGVSGGVYDSFLGTNWLIDDAGAVAFFATFEGGGVTFDTNRALFYGVPGSVELVARKGFGAPGADNAHFSNFSFPPALSSTGLLAFEGVLAGPDVTFQNDSAIWARVPGGDLTLLVRESDMIEVEPGDARTVTAVEILGGSGGQDGIGGGAEGNFVAVQVSFSDLSRAIIVYELEPAAPCPGETNSDGVVDFSDLNTVLVQFGSSGPDLAGDLNDDEVVDFTDLNILLVAFGTVCE